MLWCGHGNGHLEYNAIHYKCMFMIEVRINCSVRYTLWMKEIKSNAKNLMSLWTKNYYIVDFAWIHLNAWPFSAWLIYNDYIVLKNKRSICLLRWYVLICVERYSIRFMLSMEAEKIYIYICNKLLSQIIQILVAMNLYVQVQ